MTHLYNLIGDDFWFSLALMGISLVCATIGIIYLGVKKRKPNDRRNKNDD